jgi:urea ABC transporter ATP-binding protein UrtD
MSAGAPAVTPPVVGDVALAIEGVRLNFGGLRVLRGLSLQIPTGELRCIIGPNGAGKSTLFNVICGVLTPAEGRVVFEGEDLTGRSPHERARRGIIRKFQVPSVFGHATVRENVELAAGGRDNPFRLVGHAHKHAEAVDEALARTRLEQFAKVPAASLSHGQKQWLEIAMVVATRPKLMLLDEPTAGMTPAETRRTAQLIADAAENVTTIVIEHDIKFLREIGDHVSVLHAGAVLVEGSFEEIERNETVRDIYLGRARS